MGLEVSSLVASLVAFLVSSPALKEGEKGEEVDDEGAIDIEYIIEPFVDRTERL